MRGISIAARNQVWREGIIPAGAGHLVRSTPDTSGVPDHPRRCGAFCVSCAGCCAHGGSSPQVRGISLARVFSGLHEGIIPAGAGHFCLEISESVAAWDHPRRCGAFIRIGTGASGQAGSSPQVRGISWLGTARQAGLGIIPAGAGHFPDSEFFGVDLGDHPRRCGAFAQIDAEAAALGGSSPQVRGIWHYTEPSKRYPGIIPASAGHFFGRRVFGAHFWDHPRKCGAFYDFFACLFGFEGSSPQVRGILTHLPGLTSDIRIIPASAGHFRAGRF